MIPNEEVRAQKGENMLALSGAMIDLHTAYAWPCRFIVFGDDKILINRTLLGCLIIVFGSTSAHGYAADRAISQYQHTAWGAKEDAPQGIRSLAQTSDGYLWIGTTAGLYKFDGVHFQQFEAQSKDTLPTGAVTALFALGNGDLWIGFQSGAMSLLHKGLLSNYLLHDGGSERVMGFVQDPEGTMWAGTRGGLLRLEYGKWTAIGATWGYPASPVFTLFLDSHGTLWVGTRDTILSLRVATSHFQTTGLTLDGPAKIAEAPNGKLWVAETQRSVRPIPLGNTLLPRDETEIQVGSQAILFDRDGALWVTTVGDGLRRAANVELLKGKIGEFSRDVDSFDVTSGLTDNVSVPIVQDREGNIWVGTNSGLDRFTKTHLVPVILPINPYMSILAPGNNGHVQVCDENTLYSLDGIIAQTRHTSMGYCESSYHENDGGTWWVGEYGIYRDQDGNLKKYPAHPEAGQHAHSEMQITEDGTQTLWAAIRQFGFYRLIDKTWLHVEAPAEISKLQPRAAFTDSTNTMWFGYSSGAVVKVVNGDVQLLGNAQIGSIGEIQGRKKHIWLGGEKGLVYVDGTELVRMPPAGSSAFLAVSGVEETPSGDLWLAEHLGVVHIPASEVRQFIANHTYRVKYEVLDVHDGLPGTFLGAHMGQTSRATHSSDGRLWFLASKGLAWIDPANISRNLITPPVAIQTVMAGNRKYSASTKVNLPAGTTNLQISYTALSLADPERVRFRYMLESVDLDWQDAGTRREAFYTNLRPRQYRFRVIACNNDGVWNEAGATLKFSIAPLFYQTNVFYILCALGALALLWQLYRIRSRQLLQRVHRELSTRLDERGQIARELHDTLLQSTQGLIFLFQSFAVRLGHPNPMRAEMEQALDRADQLLNEARDRVNNLRSTGLESDYLNGLIREGQELFSGTEVVFTAITKGRSRPLSPTVADDLYCIGREALANAAAHAHAANVQVCISFDETHFCLLVRDNGIGFLLPDLPSAVARRHFGLQGIDERARRIGATLNVMSNKNEGAVIEVCVPATIAYGKSNESGWWRRAFRRAANVVGQIGKSP